MKGLKSQNFSKSISYFLLYIVFHSFQLAIRHLPLFSPFRRLENISTQSSEKTGKLPHSAIQKKPTLESHQCLLLLAIIELSLRVLSRTTTTSSIPRIKAEFTLIQTSPLGNNTGNLAPVVFLMESS